MFIKRTVATAPNGEVPAPQKTKAITPPKAPYNSFPAIENGTVPGQYIRKIDANRIPLESKAKSKSPSLGTPPVNAGDTKRTRTQ